MKKIVFVAALAAFSGNVAFANTDLTQPKLTDVRMIEIYDGHSDTTSALSLFKRDITVYKQQTIIQYLSGVERIVDQNNKEQFKATTDTIESGLKVSIQEVKPQVFHINVWHGDKPTFKTKEIFDIEMETPYQNTYKFDTVVKLLNEQICLPVSGKKRNQSVCFKVLS